MRTRVLWIEFASLMLFLYVPRVLSTLTGGTYLHNDYYFLYESVYSLARIVPVVFFVWVADGNLEAVGFTKAKWVQDFGIAILLVLITALLALPIIAGVGSTSGHHLRLGVSPLVTGLAGFLLAARGAVFVVYVVARLRELLGNAAAAVGISAVLYAIPHMLANGFGLGLSDLVLGASFGFVLFKTGRIWPILIFGLFTAYTYSMAH